MTTPIIGPAYLLGLFGVVTSGAVLPFVPTGAAVSAAAALAGGGRALLVIAVIGAGAAGAYLSDLLTYAAISFAAGRADSSPRIRLTGLAGRAVFPKPWEGVTAGIALVVIASLLANGWSHRLHPHNQA